ncbi:MAG: DUF4019 domain-containing protein [Candidatus Aureabacteria bacterium]|nr:DUF4019 domain-containing protein [Candidatus Auribacterota bacterium]
MKKVLCFVTVFIFLSISIFSSLSFANDSAKKEAVLSAINWIKLVDAGKYGKSWDTASTIFKNEISKNEWNKALKKVLSPLGKVISRKVATTHYTKTLPGAPDGQYVVIQFKTSFENKKSAIETITPMIDKDGKWRVSGYYIK